MHGNFDLSAFTFLALEQILRKPIQARSSYRKVRSYREIAETFNQSATVISGENNKWSHGWCIVKLLCRLILAITSLTSISTWMVDYIVC